MSLVAVSYPLRSEEHGRTPPAKSCQIARPQFPRAEKIIEDREARQVIADLILAAFPADSEHKTALLAAPVMGCSPRTVRNALRKEHDITGAYLLRVCAVCVAKNKNPLAVAGVAHLLRSAQ